MEKVLTIAGSDSSGGAGIQADLKTFEEYGVFGFSSLTSIVTMDPDNGWSHEVTSISEEMLEKQLISVFAGDPMDVIKTGMMGNEKNIALASQYIDYYQIKNVVIDPVIACKGTAQILQPKSVEGIKKYFLPQALIATPNLEEAGILSGLGDLENIEDMKKAASIIHQMGARNVIVKGGHRLASDKALDVFYDGKDYQVLEGPLFTTDFNHGAGCTFAAAIAAGIAKGYSVFNACKIAKEFVAAGIEHGVSINPYVGHIWHGAYNEAEKRMVAADENND
ncbi:hydroxymethylpyrimidine/phosphomethylpyrimidine kinase [Tetragenococcus halophilus subsp. flandriensis]|uniref:bifunctional hydroxymethylpyrimidine kinase/phosphomethylpyrimidine kinase n=1 Tax=Tetragenococcus halophilus TaxID=51669 RepID=UPI0023E9A03F|nr:bifunctional hydroxymethylpyrimidine kinase/phosphomethylpyrimidine kinase [Tetragenococcus halophilus]GMA07357.1 hydroxymethylpyrimidine/phosphomethylpyrimidine kinase [Tetragenococcus halophilus subsp. flandriensis]